MPLHHGLTEMCDNPVLLYLLFHCGFRHSTKPAWDCVYWAKLHPNILDTTASSPNHTEATKEFIPSTCSTACSTLTPSPLVACAHDHDRTCIVDMQMEASFTLKQWPLKFSCMLIAAYWPASLHTTPADTQYPDFTKRLQKGSACLVILNAKLICQRLRKVQAVLVAT